MSRRKNHLKTNRNREIPAKSAKLVNSQYLSSQSPKRHKIVNPMSQLDLLENHLIKTCTSKNPSWRPTPYLISEKWSYSAQAKLVLTKFDRHSQNYKLELSATSEITFFEIQDGGQPPYSISEKWNYSALGEPIHTKFDRHTQT